MSKIDQFHVGQRYFLGEVWVDDRDVYSQTECYTTQAEAMDEVAGLAGECETDINTRGKRLIKAVVVEYEVKALDDDGTVGRAESVGPGVEVTR